MDKRTVILRPAPQQADRIFDGESWRQLRARYDIVDLDGASDQEFDAVVPRAFAIIGQPDLPSARLEEAQRLRVVMNVEGNFYPNIDYETCFSRGIYVLGCGPAYADAVAEHALGLAIDLARGISNADRAFRAGQERYVSAGNANAILLRGSDIGFVGYGNLGRALHRLIAPFDAMIRVFDPWIPDGLLRELGLVPATLDELLARSAIVFVLATVTADSEQLLGPNELDLIQPLGRVVLVSRAAVIDYDSLLDRVESGRLLAAIDVWPTEPVPTDDRARRMDGLVLSPHRAGGIPQAFHRIGEMVLDDLDLIDRGLPPVRMQMAARELVGRYRNRPVS